jgi:hypothetical protein
MESQSLPALRVDRTVLTVTALTDEPDDRAYWHSRTPAERLQHNDLDNLPS